MVLGDKPDLNAWKPWRYNKYRVTSVDGVSVVVFASSANEARLDAEDAGVKVKKVEFWG